MPTQVIIRQEQHYQTGETLSLTVVEVITGDDSAAVEAAAMERAAVMQEQEGHGYRDPAYLVMDAPVVTNVNPVHPSLKDPHLD